VTQFGTTTTDCTNTNCTTEYVRLACSSLCPKHPEQRFSSTFGSYTYDCSALKRTLWITSACSNSQTSSPQISNCGTNVY